MRAILDFIVTRLRVIFFFVWMYALIELLQNQRYLTFLRPEFGWVLAAALAMFLTVTVSEITRPAGDRLHWYEFQRPLILLLPLLFLLNAQGASLDYYTFSKRFTGTAGLSVNVEPSAAGGAASRDKGPDAATARSPRGAPERKVYSSLNPSPDDRVVYNRKYDDASEVTDKNPGAQPEAATPEVNAPGQDDDSAGEDAGDIDEDAGKPGHDVTLVELYEAPKLYEGKTVAVIGMTDLNEDVAHQFGDRARILYRFLISCCAADAQPIALVFETASPVRLQSQGVWVRVMGRYTLEKKDGRTIPVLRDATMSTIPKPPNEYMY